MAAAAAAQEFEKAAVLRDRLAAVRHVHERQRSHVESGDAFDVFGLHQGEPGANVQVFRVRDGARRRPAGVLRRERRGPRAAEVLEEFLLEYYWDGPPSRPRWSRRSRTASGARRRPGGGAAPASRCGAAQRGPSAACWSWRGATPSWPPRPRSSACAREASRIEALERLRDAPRLERLPLRIECYDISNLGERHPVGSMVVFEGGVPKKAHYRKFAVRDVPARTTSR